MKRLFAIITTMAMTLMLGSVAQASYLGMNTIGDEYTWSYDMFQQITYGNGAKANIDTSDMGSALNDIMNSLDDGLYIWGYFSVNGVQDTTGSTDGWTGNTDPGSVTGLFWGLQITGWDYATNSLTFSGGNAALYFGESTAYGLSSISVEDHMIDGELDKDWVAARYAAAAAASTEEDMGNRFVEEVATLTWTPGVLGDSAETTQTMRFTTQVVTDRGTGNDTTRIAAQGSFHASFDGSTPFGSLLDSNRYGPEDADLYSAPNIETGADWHFAAKSGDAAMTAVPEPGTFLLLGLGMVGCLTYARRRRPNA